jgi:hypothetical protein
MKYLYASLLVATLFSNTSHSSNCPEGYLSNSESYNRFVVTPELIVTHNYYYDNNELIVTYRGDLATRSNTISSYININGQTDFVVFNKAQDSLWTVTLSKRNLKLSEAFNHSGTDAMFIIQFAFVNENGNWDSIYGNNYKICID